jgi:hypothetical protein
LRVKKVSIHVLLKYGSHGGIIILPPLLHGGLTFYSVVWVPGERALDRYGFSLAGFCTFLYAFTVMTIDSVSLELAIIKSHLFFTPTCTHR